MFEKYEGKILFLPNTIQRGTPAKIYKFCVKQKSLSENDSENEIEIG